MPVGIKLGTLTTDHDTSCERVWLDVDVDLPNLDVNFLEKGVSAKHRHERRFSDPEKATPCQSNSASTFSFGIIHHDRAEGRDAKREAHVQAGGVACSKIDSWRPV